MDFYSSHFFNFVVSYQYNGNKKIAFTLLPDSFKKHEFINADEIARVLSPLSGLSRMVIIHNIKEMY